MTDIKKDIVKFIRLRGYGAPPVQHYSNDAGFDLVCCQGVIIPEGSEADIETGIACQLPEASWGLIVGRSSTYRHRRLFIVPAVIDAGYRGEIKALCVNLSKQTVTIEAGERLAQIIVVPKGDRVEWVEGMTLTESDRAERGFGSTGGFQK